MTRLNRLVSSSLDLDHVLHEITAAAAQLAGTAAACFWVASPDTRTLRLVAFSDPTDGGGLAGAEPALRRGRARLGRPLRPRGQRARRLQRRPLRGARLVADPRAQELLRPPGHAGRDPPRRPRPQRPRAVSLRRRRRAAAGRLRGPGRGRHPQRLPVRGGGHRAPGRRAGPRGGEGAAGPAADLLLLQEGAQRRELLGADRDLRQRALRRAVQPQHLSGLPRRAW